MTQDISPSIQDYLKRIYEITQSGQKATTSELAEMLGISAASVTNMLQKLSKSTPPYVLYHKHHGVELTELGKTTALKILRRHRLIEQYLVEKLGYTWDEVHEEAEILEHALSPLLESRIDAALGFPRFDPHGDPIPDANLILPSIQQKPLNRLAVGESGTIVRVPHEDPQVLRYLGKSGLQPGVLVKLISRTPYDQTLRLQITGNVEEIIIGPNLGSQITIKVDS
jgi:DtxR family Mn-dependent transcriptional regulator